jgi:acetyl-CoA C-acetyltransferase
MEKIAIVGVGQTKHERRKIADSFAEMVYEATTNALADANIGIDDIDNVITVSNDFWDGRTISSMAVTDACGSYGKNVSTVEGDGTFGALYGMMRILSGYFGTTLVIAHIKGSESSMGHITNAMFDPVYERMLGLDSISSSALQARAYMDRHGITEEQCARVSVKNHKNAGNNPNAQLAMDITVADVMKSRMLAEPLKLFDCSPISDGACAVILANEKRAKKITATPAWVKGVGYCAEAYRLGDRDLTDPIALKAAAQKAYDMAGIEKPFDEIDVAELYDAFSYMELLWMEGLGFCDPGGAGALVDKGATDMGGRLPVNPSGGVLSAHPVIVAGLVRLAEAAQQVRGAAGKMQVAGAKTALAHGINGPCGQSHCVWILGAQEPGR